MQGLQPQTVKEMSSLIAKWKLERDRMHTGTTFPVGEKPDGFSWTGFVTEAPDGNGGYALLFRECSASADFKIDLKPYAKASAAEVIAGNGTAKIDGGKLAVAIPEKLGYIWLKLK